MNHGRSLRKLSRNTAHRRALLRNLATSLIVHDRIETTLPKAKELKRVADKLVTLGKNDTLHNRRQAMAYLQPLNREATKNAGKLTAVHKLFTEIATRYTERKGGYTRVVRIGHRPGDAAPMAVIEFVEAAVKAKEAPRKKRRVVKKDAAAPETTTKKSAAPKKRVSESSE